MNTSFKPFLPRRDQLSDEDKGFWTIEAYNACLQNYDSNPNYFNTFRLLSCLQNYIFMSYYELSESSKEYYKEFYSFDRDDQSALYQNKKDASQQVLGLVQSFVSNPLLIPTYHIISAQNYFLLGDLEQAKEHYIKLLEHSSIRKGPFKDDFDYWDASIVAAIINNIRLIYQIKGNNNDEKVFYAQYAYVYRFLNKCINSVSFIEDSIDINSEIVRFKKLCEVPLKHFFYEYTLCGRNAEYCGIDRFVDEITKQKRYPRLGFALDFALHDNYLYQMYDIEYEQDPYYNDLGIVLSILPRSLYNNTELFSKIDYNKTDLVNAYEIIETFLRIAQEIYNEHFNQRLDNIEIAFQTECIFILYELRKKFLLQEDLELISSLFRLSFTVSDIEMIYTSNKNEVSFTELSNIIRFSILVDNCLYESQKISSSLAEIIFLFYQEFGNYLIGRTSFDQISKFQTFIRIQADYINQNDKLLTIKLVPSIKQLMTDKISTSENQSVYQSQANPSASTVYSYESLINELDSLVGLDNIKSDVESLISFIRMQKMREAKGFKTVPVSLHLVFTGNPGTGKTTVARILAKLYKEIGVLKTGQLVEVDRSGLVAGYVGQTAIKTQEKINEAMGGVLFIDEAYALVKEGNDYGQEAIDTILKAMEDHRDEFVVIVAGYDEPMNKFINSNPGLKSRFNKYFHFPDYSANEMIEIFYKICKQYDYRLTEEADIAVQARIREMERNKGEHFANARDVRNYFENIITQQASRVGMMRNPSEEDVITITLDDVE